jgi:cyclomaltodextrinase
MIGLRRRHPWLTRATTSTAAVANEHLLVHAAAGDHRLTLALNLSDRPFPLPPRGGGVLEAGDPVRDGAVAAHSWAVLEG